MQNYLVFYGTLTPLKEAGEFDFKFYLHIPHGKDCEVPYGPHNSADLSKYYNLLKSEPIPPKGEKPRTICFIPYVKRSRSGAPPAKKNLPPIAQTDAPHYYYSLSKAGLESLARGAFLEILKNVRRSAHEGASFGERDPELSASS